MRSKRMACLPVDTGGREEKMQSMKEGKSELNFETLLKVKHAIPGK